MVWVTDFEVEDFRAARAYLKKRPDMDPRGIGFFGLSKGGSAGLFSACEDPFVRCCVTDGIYATHTTMVPYMRKWNFIYSNRPWLAKSLPLWYYRYAAKLGLKMTSRERRCSFPHLEWRIPYLAPRPLLMIHGGADNYIKPEMTQSLFDLAGEPKELWIVDGAKHNQAIQVANGAYKERILSFFDRHLASKTPAEAMEATPVGRGVHLYVGPDGAGDAETIVAESAPLGVVARALQTLAVLGLALMLPIRFLLRAF